MARRLQRLLPEGGGRRGRGLPPALVLRGEALTPRPLKALVATVEEHWDGIIAWQKHRLSNGLLEGTNSLVEAAMRRARGYRSTQKMITIIYLIAGKLPLPQIHTI